MYYVLSILLTTGDNEISEYQQPWLYVPRPRLENMQKAMLVFYFINIKNNLYHSGTLR